MDILDNLIHLAYMSLCKKEKVEIHHLSWKFPVYLHSHILPSRKAYLHTYLLPTITGMIEECGGLCFKLLMFHYYNIKLKYKIEYLVTILLNVKIAYFDEIHNYKQ